MIIHCGCDVSTFSVYVIGYISNCNCATTNDIELMIDVLNHPPLSDIPLELDLIINLCSHAERYMVPWEDNNYVII